MGKLGQEELLRFHCLPLCDFSSSRAISILDEDQSSDIIET